MTKKLYLWSLVLIFGIVCAFVLSRPKQEAIPPASLESFQQGMECVERRAWTRAKYFMQEAFDLHHPKAGYYLALSLRATLSTEQDNFSQFISLMMPLAEHNNVEAARELGLYYFDVGNIESATYWLEKASAQGDKISACRIGLHQLEINGYQNYDEGLAAIEQSAQESPILLYHLGLSRLKCDPEHLDFVRAFTQSAEKGFLPAQEHLGRVYFYPNPWVQRDWDLSKKWLEKSASAGYTPAMYQLGLWHFCADNDDITALQWIERAALKGYKEAQYFMGRRCEVLNFPQKDVIVSWYERAAQNGDLAAYNRLGVLYAQGAYGLKVDYIKSQYYLLEAAKQGHAAAQNNLGLLYFYHTQDCLESDQKAIYWFEQAAQQGYAGAIHNLNMLLHLQPG